MRTLADRVFARVAVVGGGLLFAWLVLHLAELAFG